MATTKKKQQEATTPQVEARIDRLMDGDFKTKAFASATPTVSVNKMLDVLLEQQTYYKTENE